MKSRQKRIVPHACRPTNHKNRVECKHGAPWVERLNHVGPLLICRRIANTRKLKCTGARNVLGTIFGLRNNGWLNGTSHARCMAFAGSNSDISPSDHIPIMAQTHEDSVCKGNCVRKTPLRKMIRIAQVAQTTTDDYFGGYIGKAQPAGHIEINKCIDKMYMLRDSLARDNKALLQKTKPLATAWRSIWR